jgi:NAD(P)-dependent dehydrogenase (short-subunit alcohol dehydrogenase family)
MCKNENLKKNKLMNQNIVQIIPALRMILSKNDLKSLKVIENGTPNSDTFVFENETLGAILTEVETITTIPTSLFVKGIGLIEISENNSIGRAANKTIIVTGAAQGFGEGIAACLLKQGANIVVADLNEEMGQATVASFNKIATNRALFVKTNVSDISSIENLVHETVCNFGAIDCFISNAGVLRAGGLDDMSPEDFDFVTKINYNAYFYCTKVVSRVMKLQTKYATNDYYADIIQINSKSGLRGSKANFAYAGGKFGGIGLTQSFALELAPNRIKVNSVCPGNYYEGPLWSDPENGLFVQYLRAGKVPGAKTIDDVKAFYLAQVPMNKGCNPEDVTKGVLYLMEQCGETGQALPITGGQVMLN